MVDPLTYIFEGDLLSSLTPSHFINSTLLDIDHVDRTQFKRKYRYRQGLMDCLREREHLPWDSIVIQEI